MRLTTSLRTAYGRLILVFGFLLAFLTSIAMPASPASAALSPPDVTAKGVYAFDLTTGITLFAKNEHARRPIGSTVKIATALVTVKHANLDDEVTIVEDDLVTNPSHSNMGLHAGDTLTVSQLLYGLLVPSGSDGAKALARYVGGIISDSDDPAARYHAFIDAMNAFVADAGLKDTHFTNPHGLDDPDSYSSAYDIAKLGGMLMQHEFLAHVVGEPGYSFVSAGPEARQYQAGNTNELLGEDGVTGIKTGSTENAGGCVVFAREVNSGNSLVIMSVIGADLTYNGAMIDVDERWNDAVTLFQFMDTTFAWAPLNDSSTFANLSTELSVWNVQVPGDSVIPVTTGDAPQTRYQLMLDPDGSGAISIYFGQDQVGSLKLGDTAATDASPIGREGMMPAA